MSMADHFDPSEARDPAGKWVKIVQGIKRLSQEDHTNVTKAIGELPRGGHGNRVSIKGIEVRRHQSGAVNVKIGGESRQYTSHEDAARAVIRREHVTPGTGPGIPSGPKSSGLKVPGNFKEEAPKVESGMPPGKNISLPRGIDVHKGASGNYGVTKDGKRLGIIVPEKNGLYTYEHKRGDQSSGYKSLQEAIDALLARESAGQSIGGRGETMRQYGMTETRGSATSRLEQAIRGGQSPESELTAMGLRPGMVVSTQTWRAPSHANLPHTVAKIETTSYEPGGTSNNAIRIHPDGGRPYVVSKATKFKVHIGFRT